MKSIRFACVIVSLSPQIEGESTDFDQIISWVGVGGHHVSCSFGGQWLRGGVLAQLIVWTSTPMLAFSPLAKTPFSLLRFAC